MSKRLDELVKASKILNTPKTTTPAPVASTPSVGAPASGNTSLFQSATLTEQATGIRNNPANSALFRGRTNDPVEVARNRALEQAQRDVAAFTRLRSRTADEMELYRTEREARDEANARYQSYSDKIAAAEDVIRRATEGVSADWEAKKAAEIEAAGGKYFCENARELPAMIEKILGEQYG